MLPFRPTDDERETLKKAVAKFSHEPARSHLLSSLDLPEAAFDHHGEDWNKLKLCMEQHFLHAETEVRRDPQKKSAKLSLAKADALTRKFHPNFS